MKILAVDPGSSLSAYVVWDGREITDCGKITNDAMMSLVNAIHCQGGVVFIEWITSYGMRVGAEVFDTCRWIGRYEAATNFQATLVPRREVKMWHCGRPSAKDADIVGSLKEKYGEKGTKANPGLTYPLKADIWQAFALATYVTECAKWELKRIEDGL